MSGLKFLTVFSELGIHQDTRMSTNTRQARRIQAVSKEVVDHVASRMLDPLSPFMGYFAYTGEQYRKICGASAEESVIDATLVAARARHEVLRRGFLEGARDVARTTTAARRRDTRRHK